MQALLLFPHQLFEAVLEHPVRDVFLVEDELFFRQYAFHIQKRILHRASMTQYAERLRGEGFRVHLLRTEEFPTSEAALDRIRQSGVTEPVTYELTDDWLSRRVRAIFPTLTELPSPMFLTSERESQHFFRGKRASMAGFYAAQRQQLGVLVDQDGQPKGGRWSFDTENRKKLPKGYPVPPNPTMPVGAAVSTARSEMRDAFPDAPGNAASFGWATTHDEARIWLDQFVEERLDTFGPFEDAVSVQHSVLFHSQLTAMLNIGLITPRQVIRAALARPDVPIASREGFLRQVMGWREFMRGAYLARGRAMRTRNYFGHDRELSEAFYTGTTGLAPADLVIRRVQETAYAHHIERLMIMGSLMVMLRVHPNSAYRWFMELFIDAYDWVMVPNVYGMSLYADGGTITTKPYLSGSNYLLKMSDLPRGDWCEVWDALFWCFVEDHEDLFRRNPRTSALVSTHAKRSPEQRRRLRDRALEVINALTVARRNPVPA